MSEEISPEYKEDSRNLKSLIDEGNAFQFFSPFERSKAYEETVNGETKKFIEFIGSSDQEDLVGDIMDIAALKEMEASATGTIMLRDHNRSTDKVFGWITQATLTTEKGKYVVVFKAEVDEEDNANIRIWKSIEKGRKLGASVTVIILSKADNPNRKGGLIIKSVKLLEISIVTIPCNQDSWTLAATAGKALQISEATLKTALALTEPLEQVLPAILKSADADSKKEEEIMPEQTETVVHVSENIAAAAAAENVAENVAEVAAEAAAENAAETSGAQEASKTILSRTLAAKKAHEDRKSAATASKTAPEIVAVATKGLFADEQNRRQPSLWDLFDILCAVKYDLIDRKWAMEYAAQLTGETVADDFDYVGEYTVACQEFAAAAVKSFAYYGGFAQPEDALVAEEGDDLGDDVISNALDIQKSFEVCCKLFTKLPGENKEKMLQIGNEIIEMAAKAGIPVSREAAIAATPDMQDETIRKSPIFLEQESRATGAETRVKELETELEVAKAGLNTAVEAVEFVCGQPLQIGKG